MKTYAHLATAEADGTRLVREMIRLDDKVVPGEDVYMPAFAADLVDVSSQSPQPDQGWTTADNGKTFVAPASLPPDTRHASGYALVSVLTDDEVAALGKAKAKDQHLFGKRDGVWPEDNPKIARFAAVLNTTPKVWFDRVFAPAAAG